MEVLNQSAFHVGMRCPRRLWFALREGQRHNGHPAAVAKRQEVMEAVRGNYPEARFRVSAEHRGVRVVADLLDGSTLLKVQAGTRLRHRHWRDLALKTWVLRGAGVPVERTGILHLDRRHRSGTDEPPLFKISWRELNPDLSVERERLLAIQEASERPAAELGARCRVPRPCPWWSRCHEPERPDDIRRVPGCASLADRLETEGLRSVHQLPEGLRLNAQQQRAIRCLSADVDELDPALAEHLPSPERVHYLDFEAWNPALPRFPGTQPYETLPVQWSLHTHRGGEVWGHQEWLQSGSEDPRPGFTDTLRQVLEGDDWPIVVWSPFEGRVLRRLGLPAAADRLVDLQALLGRFYYHPGFGPALSLKRVLSVMCPGEGYADLQVQDGGAATVMLQRLMEGEEDLRPALLEYCARDTWATAQVHRALLARCG